MPIQASNPPKKQNTDRPLVSQGTILILSGFLIGSSTREWIRPDLRVYAMLAGAVGVVAYFGLRAIRLRSRKRAHDRQQLQTERTIASRMSRHIPRWSASRCRDMDRSPSVAPQQYLTVATTDQMRYR